MKFQTVINITFWVTLIAMSYCLYTRIDSPQEVDQIVAAVFFFSLNLSLAVFLVAWLVNGAIKISKKVLGKLN